MYYTVETKKNKWEYKTGDKFIKKGKSYTCKRGELNVFTLSEKKFRTAIYDSSNMKHISDYPIAYEVI